MSENGAGAAPTEDKKKPKKKLTKKRLALRIILCTLGVLLLVVAGYVIYVFSSYYRIPDNQALEPLPDTDRYSTMNRVPPQRLIVEPGDQTYTIMTYNMGFGAYTPDYSFFMDGGKYSWARSKNGLIDNLRNISNMLEGYDPDFVLVQEIDEDGTRTYHIDERNYIITGIDPFQHVYARNFHSPYLMWPLNEPHGANKSGLLTMSDAYISSATRRSLPVTKSLKKILDLDRCYTVTHIPIGNERIPLRGIESKDDTTTTSQKELVLYNVHLSAYGMEDSVRDAQVSMLIEDMQAEYEKGNYVICGGDFNHNLRPGSTDQAPDWAQPFPFEKLPSFLSFAHLSIDCDYSHNTCRNADEAYNPDTTFTVMADGFIVSDNVEVVYYENIDLQYAYSDHDPVILKFRLK